jgi:hypothetical protein
MFYEGNVEEILDKLLLEADVAKIVIDGDSETLHLLQDSVRGS